MFFHNISALSLSVSLFFFSCNSYHFMVKYPVMVLFEGKHTFWRFSVNSCNRRNFFSLVIISIFPILTDIKWLTLKNFFPFLINRLGCINLISGRHKLCVFILGVRLSAVSQKKLFNFFFIEILKSLKPIFLCLILIICVMLQTRLNINISVAFRIVWYHTNTALLHYSLLENFAALQANLFNMSKLQQIRTSYRMNRAILTDAARQ